MKIKKMHTGKILTILAVLAAGALATRCDKVRAVNVRGVVRDSGGTAIQTATVSISSASVTGCCSMSDDCSAKVNTDGTWNIGWWVMDCGAVSKACEYTVSAPGFTSKTTTYQINNACDQVYLETTLSP